MKHAITHELSTDLARRATRRAFEAYKKDYASFDPQVEWVGEDRARVALTIAGAGITGLVELKPGRVELEVQVPMMFRMFRKRAVAIIESEIQEWIARARDGRLDDEG